MEQAGKSSSLRFVAGWVVIMLGVLATPILGGTAAAQRPSLPTRPTTPQTGGSVPGRSGEGRECINFMDSLYLGIMCKNTVSGE
jgi:hypothetical protein